MDITESITKAIIDHVFLIMGLAVIFWWGLRNVFPREFRSMLSNGGGDIIRKIVKDENAMSETRQSDEFRLIIKEHEVVEQEHFERLMEQDSEIQLILARHDERIKVLEDAVKELVKK